MPFLKPRIALQHIRRPLVPRVQLPLVLVDARRPAALDVRTADAQLALGQAHAGEELHRRAPLERASVRVPAQLVGHQVDDGGQGVERGLGVQEGEPGPPRQDVDGGLGVLVTDGVADLAVDEGVEGGDAQAADGEAAVGGARQCGDGPGAVAVGFRQVAGDVGLEAEVLDQVDEEGFGVAVGADQTDLVRLAGAVEGGGVVDHLGAADVRDAGHGCRAQVVEFDGFVDRLFGHLPVGRPFPAGAGQQAGVGDCDEVVPDEGLGVAGFRIAY